MIPSSIVVVGVLVLLGFIVLQSVHRRRYYGVRYTQHDNITVVPGYLIAPVWTQLELSIRRLNLAMMRSGTKMNVAWTLRNAVRLSQGRLQLQEHYSGDAVGRDRIMTVSLLAPALRSGRPRRLDVRFRNGVWPHFSWASDDTHRVIRDKYATLQCISEHGLAAAVPQCVRIAVPVCCNGRERDQVITEQWITSVLPSSMSFPVVLKPCHGYQGRRVHVGVVSAQAIAHILCRETAAQHRYGCKDGNDRNEIWLVEEYVPGVSYRVLVACGQVMSVVARYPAQVIGDGVSSIAALVDRANGAVLSSCRRSRVNDNDNTITTSTGVPLRVDPATLHWQGFESSSANNLMRLIPPRDRPVLLQRVSNNSKGGDTRHVALANVHSDNISLFCAAVACFSGLRVAAVDFLSVDITRSWRSVGAKIHELEVNMGIDLHVTNDTVPATESRVITDTLIRYLNEREQ